MAKRTQQNAWNEVYALILLGTGTLLFLALISYVPRDIPTWFPLLNSTSSPNRPAQNFLGPLGAVVGDFLDKPVAKGGLNLSRYSASAALFVFIVACILIFKQRAASKSH